MRVTFYLDEDVPLSFGEALRVRGVDALSTQQAGNKGFTDLEQLLFADEHGRVIITHNKKDFILLHKHFLEKKKQHHGIILSDQQPIGILLKRAMKLWFALNSEEMKNRLEFLSTWR